MSIASNRSRRPNAGSKMNEVSGKEDDEFYKQAYGGFVEDDNDNEFEPECSDDEAVESIRENGESADLDDKEHPPAKRLKTEAKAGEDAESDEDAESVEDVESDDDDDDDDDDDEEDEEDEVAEEENGDEDDDAEGEEEEEDDEDEADEDDSIDAGAKKSKKAEAEAIPEKSKAE